MYFLRPGGVLREDGAFIPADERNSDWQAFTAWRDAGGTPEAAPAVDNDGRPEKLAALKAEFEKAFSAPVTFQGNQYDADPESKARLTSVLATYAGADLPEGFYWVDATNAQRELGYAQLQALALAMADKGWEAFKAYQDAKTALGVA